MSRHGTLLGAFTPAKEIDNPEYFAGRKRQVGLLVDALHIAGSAPLIFGHRGLGKTSLAIQLQRVALGDMELLESLGLSRKALSEDQYFMTFFVTCTDSTQNFEGLVNSLINAIETIEIEQIKSNTLHLVDRATTRKLTLKVFEVSSTRKFEVEKAEIPYGSLTPSEKLESLCSALYKAYGQPILFIVDELDRLDDTSGLASFVKAVSGDHVKFMLVGIASNLSDLLTDHQSLERSLTPVRVPLMNEGELCEIVDNAERYLEEHDIDIRFDDFAKTRLAAISGGFPWFVHVIGQAALVSADEAGADEILEGDVIKAARSISENRFAQQFKDMYQAAVRDSMQREIVLRTFAEWTDQDIPTGAVYPILREKLGVANPSVYKGHLSQDFYGKILFAPSFQDRGLVRFTNEMFKVYCRLRPSLFMDVDDKVSAACK